MPTLTSKGYLRHTAGPIRGRYVHRETLAVLCRVWCYYPLAADGLPAGFTVEHLDHRRAHNCHTNLILLQKEIHDYLS